MKLLDFMAKYRIACRWILLGFILLFMFVLGYFNVPLIILLIIYLGLMFVVFIFTEVYPPLLIQKKYLNLMNMECNPFPFLHNSQKLLTYNLSNGVRKIVTINYCVALRNTGDYEKCYEILKSINVDPIAIDSNSRATKDYPTKLVLFNNIADVCFFLKKTEEEIEYHNKVIEIYEKMPEGANKKAYKNLYDLTKSAMYFHNGEYEKALEFFANYTPKSPENAVSIAFSKALIHIEQKDFENARKQLNFIVENGNKLYAVVEAKKLLESL